MAREKKKKKRQVKYKRGSLVSPFLDRSLRKLKTNNDFSPQHLKTFALHIFQLPAARSATFTKVPLPPGALSVAGRRLGGFSLCCNRFYTTFFSAPCSQKGFFSCQFIPSFIDFSFLGCALWAMMILETKRSRGRQWRPETSWPPTPPPDLIEEALTLASI